MTDYRILRLQVQRGPVKVGRAPLRRYEPAALVPVERLLAEPRGVRGIAADGEEILDVHHTEHPRTRDRKGRGGILFIGTGDYAALRARYGDHVVDGIAGETILLDAQEGLAGRRLSSTATITTADGTLELHRVRVAEPCIEFSRFCLRREPTPVVDEVLKQTLVDLDDGARGYRSISSAEGIIATGDILTI